MQHRGLGNAKALIQTHTLSHSTHTRTSFAVSPASLVADLRPIHADLRPSHLLDNRTQHYHHLKTLILLCPSSSPSNLNSRSPLGTSPEPSHARATHTASFRRGALLTRPTPGCLVSVISIICLASFMSAAVPYTADRLAFDPRSGKTAGEEVYDRSAPARFLGSCAGPAKRGRGGDGGLAELGGRCGVPVGWGRTAERERQREECSKSEQ